MAKDRLKSATGGRVELKGGGADFMIQTHLEALLQCAVDGTIVLYHRGPSGRR